jgi:hypothetical protein
LRVDPIDLAHAAREGRLGRLQEQVEVLVHQAPRPDAPRIALAYAPEVVDERRTVLIVLEDRLPRITSRHRVIESAVELDAKWPGHATCIVRRDARSKT